MSGAADYFVHESSYVDEPSTTGSGTRMWHFSHVMKDSSIGANCNIGQNVVILSGRVVGNHVKIQNNVSFYTGVTLAEQKSAAATCSCGVSYRKEGSQVRQVSSSETGKE